MFRNQELDLTCTWLTLVIFRNFQTWISPKVEFWIFFCIRHIRHNIFIRKVKIGCLATSLGSPWSLQDPQAAYLQHLGWLSSVRTLCAMMLAANKVDGVKSPKMATGVGFFVFAFQNDKILLFIIVRRSLSALRRIWHQIAKNRLQ